MKNKKKDPASENNKSLVLLVEKYPIWKVATNLIPNRQIAYKWSYLNANVMIQMKFFYSICSEKQMENLIHQNTLSFNINMCIAAVKKKADTISLVDKI